MSRVVVLGGAESGVGAAVLAKVKGFDVFLSDNGKLKDDYPSSNIVAIDYDPGATKINQENRVKLMLANARSTSAV